ncbi:MAG: sulfite exporter TauE/SafE family protein [Lachnospiraceae bacterium]|nr:TSUP family transporter [Lachnospiraceae bacterium]MDD6617691.1 TSUP family transporter [Clostridiales bacterium]MDY4769988.1 TSUP family transporter [Lachnospiraceae bacterium]
MELTVTTFLIVCPLVFLGAFVDAIAGGGGLITLPAYLIAGVPPHYAVATNKLSSAGGTIFSTARFCKNGYADFRLAVPGILAALLGSSLGAHIALRVDDQVFKIMLVILLPIIAFYVLTKKDLEPSQEKKISRKLQYVIVILASFAIGMYDGFYGPGTGTFLILVYTSLAKMDVLTSAGNTKLVNLTSNLSALVVFLMNGVVILPLGLAAVVFSIAGHYLGAGMAMKNGGKFIRVIILAVIAMLFIKTIMEAIG